MSVPQVHFLVGENTVAFLGDTNYRGYVDAVITTYNGDYDRKTIEGSLSREDAVNVVNYLTEVFSIIPVQRTAYE